MFCKEYTTYIGPYDFRDAENTDGIAESRHKDGICCIKLNLANGLFCKQKVALNG